MPPGSITSAARGRSRHAGLVIVVSAAAAYFGILLIPEWWPGLAASPAYFVYILSIPVVLLVLVGLAVAGAAGFILTWRRGSPVSDRARQLLTLALAGFVLFGSVVVLARSMRGALPTGSRLLTFDAAVWQDPGSWTSAEDGITPRQKMLGSVVDELLPGRSRSELESLLGPSLETPYFTSSRRDLIYVLGAERDTIFPIDSEWLLIWLDDSGRFERYEIWTD